jgi:hypothetical protein
LYVKCRAYLSFFERPPAGQRTSRNKKDPPPKITIHSLSSPHVAI